MFKKILLFLMLSAPVFAVPSSNTPAANAPSAAGGVGGGTGDIDSVWTDPLGDVSSLIADGTDLLDAGSASASSPGTRSASLPGTCTEGQIHQDTDSGSSETYVCTATNTWTKLASVSELGNATRLEEGATETDLSYDATANRFYHDTDGDDAKDVGEQYASRPNEFWAEDYASGSTTAGIQGAIDACGEGAGSFGCVVHLPRQTAGPTCTNITSQIVIGDETGTTNQQHSITLEGYGFGNGFSDVAATRICYTGAALAAGEGVIQITGNNHKLTGFSLNANDLADYGIHITGTNAGSALSNGGQIRDMGIYDANIAGIQIGNSGVALQADLWDLSNLRISEPDSVAPLMDFCIRSSGSSGDALQDHIVNMECKDYEVAGIEIEAGGFEIRGNTFLTENNAGGLFAIRVGPNNTYPQTIANNEFQLADGGCIKKTYSGGGAAPLQVFTVTGNRCYLSDAANTAAHFDYNADGPLFMAGNEFDEGSDRTSPPTHRVIIGNGNQATSPLKVVDVANNYGGMNGRPVFKPTYNNSVTPLTDENARVFHAANYSNGSSTGGIQEAINACGKGSTTDDIGCIVMLPKGTVSVNATIKVGDNTTLANSQWGITLQGYGSGIISSGSDNLAGTTLKWTAGVASDVIQVSGMGHHFADFMIAGNATAANGIVQLGNNGTGNVTGKNVYERIAIFDVLDSLAGTQGWGFSFGTSDLGQNDHTVLDQVRIVNSRHCLRQLDTQAIENELRMFECANFTASPGIMVARGGLTIESGFLHAASTNTNAVGVQVDSCATVFRWNKGSIEWIADNGTIYRDSDTGLGCGTGARYVRSIRDVRFQLQQTATTEHTCVEHTTANTLLLEGNIWTSNNGDAGRKCDLEFNNPHATLTVPIVMNANRNSWNNGADETDVVMTVTSTGGGPITIQRNDIGVVQVRTPAGVNTEPWKNYDRWYDWTSGMLWDGTALTKMANRCQGSQRVIQGLALAPNGPFKGYIGGTGTVTTEDYKTLAGSPSMGVCIFIAGRGASPDANGYPDDSATNAVLNFSAGVGRIEWALNASIDNASQSKWSEFIRIGNSDRVGFTTNTLSNIDTASWVNNLAMNGYIRAMTNTDRDQDGGVDPILPGEFPLPQFHRTGAKSTTHVFWHEAGQMTRGDYGQLHRYFGNAAGGFDRDDFCYSHSWQGWINNYGETECYWSGVGIYGFGNWDGAHEGGELAGNQFGIILDDLKTPGQQHAWSSCTSGFCSTRNPSAGGEAGFHEFKNMTIEGNRINELAAGVHGGNFSNVWFERNGGFAGTAGTGGSSTVIDNLTGTSFNASGGTQDFVGGFIWNLTDDSYCRIASVTDSDTATCVEALNPSGSFDNGDSVYVIVVKADGIALGVGLDSENRVCVRDNQWAPASTCTWQGVSSNFASSFRFDGGFMPGDGNWPGFEGLSLGPFAVNDAANYGSHVVINSNMSGSDIDTSDTTSTIQLFVPNSASKTRVDVTGNLNNYNHPPPAGYAYTINRKRLSPRMITAIPTSAQDVLWLNEVVIVANGVSLGDCDPAAPTGTAHTLCYETGSGLAVVGDGTGGATALDGLTDVTLTTPATGATLIKSAGDWIDGQLDLADTDAVTGVLPDANIDSALHRDSETKDGDLVSFDDQDGNFTATDVDEAIEELDDVINGGIPNSATAKVDWSELQNVPAGFADNTDDGAGGSGDEIEVNGVAAASPVDLRDSSNVDPILCTGAATPHAACAASGDVVFNIGTGVITATELAAGSLTAADAAADLAIQTELDGLTLPNTGQTGNRVVKSTGTTGDLVESGISVDASNNVDGIGTLDADGAVTAPSFTADAVPLPTITFDDSDSASEASDATITAQATDAGAGTEDVDVTISTQVNSILTARVTIDADGRTTIPVLTSDTPEFSGTVTSTSTAGVGMRHFSHATDCTALTTGALGDVCWEQDANTIYACEPTAGGCDTAGEWILASGGGGVTASGTPVNDQIAIWTSASAIEGDADLTFNGTDLAVTGAVTAGSGTNAATGNVRLPNTGAINWRNNANSADVGISKDTSDRLVLTGITGTVLPEQAAPGTSPASTMTLYANNAATPDVCAKDDAGNVSCMRDGAGGSGDSIEVEAGDNGGTFDAIDTTAQLEDSGDINWVRAGAGAPHQISGEYRADSLAVADVADGDWGDFSISGNVANVDANALTGSDIDESTLGIVPSSTTSLALDGTSNNPDIRQVTTATCPSGWFHDFGTPPNGTFDFGTDRCLTADQIFYAQDYLNNGTTTTAGINEATAAACAAFPTTPYGGVVVAPRGNITITGGIIIPCNWITLAGAAGGSRLIYTVAGIDVITVIAEANVTIRDINIDPAVADAGNRGIVLKSSREGTHTGANNVAVLTDSAADDNGYPGFQIGNVSHIIRNITDNSSCTIGGGDWTTITISCTLAGGTDNDWDTGDAYRIDIAGPGAFHIENVIATGETQTGIGLVCDGCLKGTINNSHFANWNDGAFFTGTINSAYPNANSASGSTFSSNADDGIYIEQLNANFGLQDVAFESNGGDGIECSASTNGYAIVAGDSLYFEGNLNAALHRPTSGCGFAISKSRWSDSGTAPDYLREDTSTQKSDIFTENHFSDNGVTNTSGVPIPIMFSIRTNGVETSCANPLVCNLYDATNLAREVWTTEFLDTDASHHGLQGAINSVCTDVTSDANAVYGGIVNIPAGVFSFSTNYITIPANCWVQIRGQGLDNYNGGTNSGAGTLLEFNLTGGGDAFTFTAPNQHWSVSNLTIEMANGVSGSTVFNIPANNDHWTIDNVYTVHSGVAVANGIIIDITDSQSFKILNSRLEGFGTAISIAGSEGNGGGHIINNKIRPAVGTAAGTGISISGTYPCVELQLEKNIIESGKYNVDATSSGGTCFINFDGNYFEPSTTPADPPYENVRVAANIATNFTGNFFNPSSPSLAFHRTSANSSVDAVDTFNGNEHRGDIQMDAGECVVTSVSKGAGSVSACTQVPQDKVIALEGATLDAFEIRITPSDPTVDRVVNLPDADSTTVQANTGAANEFLTAISAAGLVSRAQPSFSNISGSVTDGQVPDNITASNYMPLIGGTFANGGTAPVVVIDDEGVVRFTEEDAGGANYQALKGAAAYAGDATFSLNITAATCTGDGNGGALTVNGSNEIVCSADDGGGSATAIDALGDVGAGDDTVGLAEQGQTWTWNTDDTTAAVFDGLKLVLIKDAVTTDSGAQELLSITQANSGNDAQGNTETLVHIENLDVDDDVDTGILMEATGGSGGEIILGIDLSDVDIRDAISIGSNHFLVTGAQLEYTELAILDNGITLNTDTAGNYVETGASGVGVALTGGGSEGATLTAALDFSQTLAGNPAYNAGEMVFTDDCPGGGFLSEGNTGANTNEQLHCFPTQDGVDTTDYIATGNSSGAALDLAAATEVVSDAEVENNITASNYLLLTGGTLANAGTAPILVVDDAGEIRFTEEDAGGANYQALKGAAAYGADATFVLNITAATCTGDGNGGALTIIAGEIVCSADDGGAGGSAIDALSDAGAGDDVIGLAEQGQTWTWDTAATAGAFDGLSLTLTDDSTAGATTQRVLVVERNDSTGTATTETLIQINNNDTDGAVTTAIEVTAAAGTVGTAADLSDAEIVTALALGANDTTVGGVTVSSTEFASLDGGNAWTDAADPITQRTITKDVHIGDGAGTLVGKLEVGGDADQPQVVIEAFSTQTDDVLIVQTDADVEVFTISAAGVTQQDGSATIGAPAEAADSTTGVNVDNNVNGLCWENSTPGTDVCFLADASEVVQISGGFLDGTDINASSIPTSKFTATSGTGAVALVDSPVFTTGVTVPANSISDEELDEGATFTWTGTHDFTGATATASTPPSSDNDTSVATSAFVSSSTATFTNKSYDTAGTGNVFKMPALYVFEAASCSAGATGALQWDTDATGAPTASCVQGATEVDLVAASADFADAALARMQRSVMLPSDWSDDDITVRLKWKSNTTNTALTSVWQIEVVCTASGSVRGGAAYDADIASVADDGLATANADNDATITLTNTTTLSGCAAGDNLNLQFFRDPAHASDDLATTASLLYVELSINRSM